MILLLALLFVLRTAQGRCQEEESCFHLDGEIRHLSLANNSVYISTEEKLYQLNHELTLVHSQTQRVIMRPGKESHTGLFDRVSGSTSRNDTFRINVFLPFVENKTLISCGETSDCGYCEILDLKNISNIIHYEHIQVGPLGRSSGSVALLVTLKKTDTFILTAIQQGYQNKEGKCPSELETVNLHDVKDRGNGIFSLLDSKSKLSVIKSKGKAEFVDGFKVRSNIYLLSNVQPSDNKNNKVRLIWFEAKNSKTETLESVRGVALSIPGGREGSRLLASSHVPGEEPLLWSGVFSVDGGLTNTVLVLFDISPDNTIMTNKDQDFYFDKVDMSPSVDELNDTAQVWNAHNIRPSRNTNVPSGRPNVMYALPELYGTRDYLSPVEDENVNLCKDQCVFRLTRPCDPDVYDLCNIFMAESHLTPPTDPYDAVSLYLWLRDAITASL